MDALRKYGLLVEESLIIDCGIMMEKGIMAAHQILEMEKCQMEFCSERSGGDRSDENSSEKQD